MTAIQRPHGTARPLSKRRNVRGRGGDRAAPGLSRRRVGRACGQPHCACLHPGRCARARETLSATCRRRALPNDAGLTCYTLTSGTFGTEPRGEEPPPFGPDGLRRGRRAVGLAPRGALVS